MADQSSDHRTAHRCVAWIRTLTNMDREGRVLAPAQDRDRGRTDILREVGHHHLGFAGAEAKGADATKVRREFRC